MDVPYGTLHCTLYVRTHTSTHTYMHAYVQVFFDVDIGGEKAGRIVFELSADVVPKTAGAWWFHSFKRRRGWMWMNRGGGGGGMTSAVQWRRWGGRSHA
jgi:hypothetical protein